MVLSEDDIIHLFNLTYNPHFISRLTDMQVIMEIHVHAIGFFFSIKWNSKCFMQKKRAETRKNFPYEK